MEIMKYFIKRKSENIKKAAFGSALLVVSAFAMYTAPAFADTQESATAMKSEKGGKTDKTGKEEGKEFTARKVFENLKSSSLEMLPKTTRLDMLDYWDVDSTYKALNVMEGLSWLEAVTPTYLKVRITAVSSLEIKILPAKKGDLAMTIYTVGDDVQAQDSQVSFYDENLNELPADKYFVMPQVKDFFDIPKGSATKMKEIEEMIPFPTIALSANPDNTEVEARLTVEKFINEDDWNIAKLFVKPYIKLEWKKDKYKY